MFASEVEAILDGVRGGDNESEDAIRLRKTARLHAVLGLEAPKKSGFRDPAQLPQFRNF